MNPTKKKILVVDDNQDILNLLQRHIKTFNHHTYKASSVHEAISILKDFEINLLITDLNMPETDGTELLKYCNEHYPSMPKLVITGFPSIDNAVISIKSGALEYLAKPFTKDELLKALQLSFEGTKSVLKNAKNEVSSEENFEGIIGRSEQFKDLVATVNRVKDNKVTVLIEGESGTGKELIAKSIHYKGAFSRMPFISVNCGGLPENLIESELFGYTKGAFTGASESKTGLIQASAGGTLFLDEIGNASPTLQTRLLRVLQEKEITKVGATNSEKIDIRIIAATNNDLHQMVLDGTFREDLYYRINVVNIKTTPLRERKEDIVPLIHNFLSKYSKEYKIPPVTIEDKAIEILLRYDWPGNIRELENIIQRMLIMSDEIIMLKNVPEHLKYHIPQQSIFFKTLKEFEKEQIMKVLNSVGNNKTKAAKILNIDRKTLNQKITN